jgi:hypothetical protein
MTDEMLDRLGNYFIYFEVMNKWGIEFHEFVSLVLKNRWEDLV